MQYAVMQTQIFMCSLRRTPLRCRVCVRQESTSRVDIQPTVCEIKVRLLVMLHFATDPDGPILVKLFKVFVQHLADQARTHGFGCTGMPQVTDIQALETLVVKYKLEKYIEGPWNGLLSHPEKLTITRKLGESRKDFVRFGMAATSAILDLCYISATCLHVNDMPYLFNSVSCKKIMLPVVDSSDMLWVPAKMNMDYPFKNCVLVDEAHDIDVPQALALKSMVARGSKLLTVDDIAQALLTHMACRLCIHLSEHASDHNDPPISCFLL